MAAALPHRVRRLRWQARAPTTEAAFALRSLLREASGPVAEALDGALSACDADGRVVRVPRLELKVKVGGGMTAEDLAARVAEEASAALARFVAATHSGAARPRSGGEESAAAGELRAELAAYLATGAVGWALAGLPAGEAAALLAEAAEREAPEGTLPGCLRQLPLPERLAGLVRWLALLTPDRRAVLVARGGHGEDGGYPVAAALRLALGAPSAADRLHAGALWLAWTLDPGLGAPEAAAAWAGKAREWVARLPGAAEAGSPWKAVTRALGGPDGREPPAAGPEAPATPPGSDREPDELAALLGERAAEEPPGLPVPHAGLVLLHPWLARLFDATGLYPAGGRGPLDPGRLPRAAALLHWLATGGEEARELELSFVKVLLGSAPDAPLPCAPPAPTVAERDEAGALLDGALAYWTALRGTSHDGLRQGFLQRRGSLSRRDHGWCLRVEPASFDVLLGMLPWGFGVVRLPWMAAPLFTEWGSP